MSLLLTQLGITLSVPCRITHRDCVQTSQAYPSVRLCWHMYRQVHADFASQCGRWWPVICLCLILVDSWPFNQPLPPHMLRSSTMRPQYTDLFRLLHRFVYRLHSSGTACHDERQYRRQVLYTCSIILDQALTLVGRRIAKHILVRRHGAIYNYILVSFAQVGSQPRQRFVRDTECVLKPSRQDFVLDRVECAWQI